MNFKFLLVVVFLTGCGLKTRPSPPAGKKIPSIESQYIKKIKAKKKKEQKATP